MMTLTFDDLLSSMFFGFLDCIQVVNYSTTDIERIYQSFQLSMLIVGAPLMWILNVVYCYLLLGPWSLLANFLILSYYPIMVSIVS